MNVDAGARTPVEGALAYERRLKQEAREQRSAAVKAWAAHRGYISAFAIAGIAITATADLATRLPDGSRVATVLIAGSLCFGIVVAALVIGKRTFLQPGRSVPVAWVLLGAWLAFVCIYRGLTVGGAQNVMVYLILIVGIWYQARRCRPSTPDALAKWMVRAGWVLAALAAGQTLVSGFNSEGAIGRRSFGLVAMFALAVVCAYWSRLPIRHRWLAPLLLVEIAVSGSRLSLALGLLVVAGSTLARHPHPRRLVVRGLVVLAGFGALVWFWPPLYYRFFGGDQGLTIGGFVINTEGRWPVWVELWQRFQDNPWGLGLGEAQRITVITSHGLVPQPHNEYLRLAVDAGLPGVILFVSGALVIVRWLLRLVRDDVEHRPLHVAALISFGAMLGQAFTDNPLIYFFVVTPCAVLVGTSLAFLRPTASPRPSGS